jgi:hypothetical protein
VKGRYIATSIARQTVGTRGFVVLALSIAAFTNPLVIRAQSQPAQVDKVPKVRTASSDKISPAVQIKVKSFRNQLVAGSGVGVMADITNASAAPVYLQNVDVELVLPPEVEQSNGKIWTTAASFPTEAKELSVISLKPNETYRVFWNRNLAQDSENAPPPAVGTWFVPIGWLSKIVSFRGLEFAGFTPGEYPITVEMKYWDHEKFDGDDYHTVVESYAAQFGAPQSVILLGATLGGLIFAVLSLLRAEQDNKTAAAAGIVDFFKTLGKGTATLCGSVLLSVIVTILLSRISETQFFIKVSVSDFWGAIAIGFLANYGGWALLDKIIPPTGKKVDAPTAQKENARMISKAQESASKVSDSVPGVAAPPNAIHKNSVDPTE